jgi:hypothetical protein
MLYREITFVCLQIHTKHMDTLCSQKVELLDVKTCGAAGNYCAVQTSVRRQIPLYIQHN